MGQHEDGRRVDLRDGRVDDAGLAEPLLQAFGDLERAAVDADVFAHDEHAFVGAHLFEERLADGFEIGNDGHVSSIPGRPFRPALR